MKTLINKDDVVVKRNKSYYEAVYNGSVLFTADTLTECCDELETMTSENLTELYYGYKI